jgi:prepilin-type N-terminal cleavage/methylation domain-containing protein
MVERQRGFTLVELLIVVVIIGILATIAIPKFVNTKERAYLASMKADLRNLATAQESYLADYYTYTTDLGTSYLTSRGVSVALSGVSASGWSAIAAHTGTTKSCAMFYGSGATPTPPATQEGEPACDT